MDVFFFSTSEVLCSLIGCFKAKLPNQEYCINIVNTIYENFRKKPPVLWYKPVLNFLHAPTYNALSVMSFLGYELRVLDHLPYSSDFVLCGFILTTCSVALNSTQYACCE